MFNSSVSNRELITFFAVTFGLTIGMGFVMAFAYTKYPVAVFSELQAYYPAIGVMVALLLNSEKRKRLPMNFYGTYLGFTITSILLVVAEVLMLHQEPGTYMSYLTIPGSMMLILMYLSEEKDKIYDFGLGIRKNLKASLGYILLFIILYLCLGILGELIYGNIRGITTSFSNLKKLTDIIPIMFLFLLSFPAFLGEEYGWRYFLQRSLQERMGKRKGVIVLGLIWGIWHLPLNLFLYNPAAPFYSILSQLIVCIAYSVFFGLVYMKTGNVWTVSIIHFINNAFASIFNNGEVTNFTLSWKTILINLVCAFIIYMPFLFAKEYRKTETKPRDYIY